MSETKKELETVKSKTGRSSKRKNRQAQDVQLAVYKVKNKSGDVFTVSKQYYETNKSALSIVE